MELKNQFDARLEDVARSFAQANNQRFSRSWVDDIEITEENILLSGSEPCGRGCCSDHWSLQIPSYFFWDDEALSRFRADQEQKRQKEADQKALADLRRKEETERQRRAQYELLKKEYGNDEK